jgi:hypothetical protein|eukprot:3936150-Rhodomonas_salina.1
MNYSTPIGPPAEIRAGLGLLALRGVNPHPKSSVAPMHQESARFLGQLWLKIVTLPLDAPPPTFLRHLKTPAHHT